MPIVGEGTAHTCDRIRREVRSKMMNGHDHQVATDSELDAWIDRVKQLPTAPALVGDLLGLFRDPDREVDRVVEVISLCPSLTAEILRRCNSASFSRGEPIEDMFSAISRIGFYEVYCMVTTLMAAQTLDMAGAERGVDLDNLWQHSVLTAVAAEQLATAAQLADRIAHRLLDTTTAGDASQVLDSSQGEALGLTPAELEALATTTWEAYDRVKDHMSRH